MAHWARIDENNIVIEVTVGDDNDPNGDEGYQWLVDNIGGRWLKTSYNSYGGVHYLPDNQRDEKDNRVPSGKPHLRYNYASIGFSYDEETDAFVPPKPERGEWYLDKNTFLWEEVNTEE